MKAHSLRERDAVSLSGNALKLLAAAAMTVDHVGLVLLPQVQALRLIGRLAFPIFAFMIAEGCAHTRAPLRYLLSVLTLALVCQTAYTVAMDSWFLCVPVSFAIAIALVLTLDRWKLSGNLLWGIALLLGIAAVWWLTARVTLDYGFWGCMMPLGASLFRGSKRLDRNPVHVLAMGVCMIPLALQLGLWQWWSFLALPLLTLYSGKRGRWKLKYFFYIFYPAHLLVIQGIALLLSM